MDIKWMSQTLEMSHLDELSVPELSEYETFPLFITNTE